MLEYSTIPFNKELQKRCAHKWHGPCIDKKSRYYKCEICYVIDRDTDKLIIKNKGPVGPVEHLIPPTTSGATYKFKSNRGGKRERAGRPSLPQDKRRQTLTIRLRPQYLRWLNQQNYKDFAGAKLSKSRIIELILFKHIEMVEGHENQLANNS